MFATDLTFLISIVLEIIPRRNLHHKNNYHPIFQVFRLSNITEIVILDLDFIFVLFYTSKFFKHVLLLLKSNSYMKIQVYSLNITKLIVI